MRNKSLLSTLLKAALAAAVLAAACWVIYYYRDTIRWWLGEAKQKGKKLLDRCFEEITDFADR